MDLSANIINFLPSAYVTYERVYFNFRVLCFLFEDCPVSLVGNKSIVHCIEKLTKHCFRFWPSSSVFLQFINEIFLLMLTLDLK